MEKVKAMDTPVSSFFSCRNHILAVSLTLHDVSLILNRPHSANFKDKYVPQYYISWP
jgi:hypothetical protein